MKIINIWTQKIIFFKIEKLLYFVEENDNNEVSISNKKVVLNLGKIIKPGNKFIAVAISS